MAGQHLSRPLCRRPVAAIRVPVPAQLRLVAQIRAGAARSGPISRRSRATAASPNSSASTRRSSAARFTDGRWHIETASGNTDVADVFICATGFLHKPLLPDIAGRESFAGPSFHSARWDHSVPYQGQALGRHRQRRQRRADHRGTGLGRVRGHPVHPPRAMGPYPREPAFDLARAAEAAAARRLSARAAPAVAIHQRKRPLAPRARAAARGDGARIPRPISTTSRTPS